MSRPVILSQNDGPNPYRLQYFARNTRKFNNSSITARKPHEYS